MRLFDKIVRKNKKESLIESGDKIVVGFSGGPDSVFLVEMLLKLKEKIDFDLVLVHINHLLRGEEAQRDEDFSIDYGKRRGLEVFARKIDITTLGKEKGLTLEEAGREARYDYYHEIMRKIGGNKIALAHNKDDQIETFMFRLSRGTGLSGLEGIVSKRDMYIRPISEIYKSDILNYLDSNSIPYCIDSTNLENEFTRNSIRLDLIPFIEQRYNPRFKDKIFSLIEEIREINEFVKEEINSFTDVEVLNIDQILKFSKTLRGKILSNYLYRYGLELNRKKILLIESILEKGGSQEIFLNNEYILKKEYNLLKVLKKNSVKDSIKEIELIIPGKVIFGEYIITAEYTKRDEQNRNCFYTSLKEGDSVIIRGRKDGDKIIPTGMKGEKKIKDIFINEKIEKDRRESIPLVTYGDEIVWIAGIRGSEKYSCTDKECVKLSVRRTK
jgi:tRNA(Ile)-lysidine synthase